MTASHPLHSLRRTLAAVLPKKLGRFAKRRARHLRLGARGEKMACRALQEIGLDILCRNYRIRGGEIDIIARDDCVLCFIEVKTRHYRPFSRPADAVTTRKRQRIIRAARRYLRNTGQPPLHYRFDVVEVIFKSWRLDELRHWPAIFDEHSVAVASGRAAREAADAKPLQFPPHV